jgi:hypothetical protein
LSYISAFDNLSEIEADDLDFALFENDDEEAFHLHLSL